MLKTCLTCKKDFNAKKSIRRFCSKVCFANYPPFKEKWRLQLIEHPIRPEKVTRPWDGKTRPEMQGSLHPNFGKKLSQQARLEISETVKRLHEEGVYQRPETKSKMRVSQKLAAKKRPNYKGGITPTTAQIRGHALYKEWRRLVFRRDNFTCQVCGVRGGYLHAHHKKSFSILISEHRITELQAALACAELWDIDNGITYCVPCHKKMHLHEVNI